MKASAEAIFDLGLLIDFFWLLFVPSIFGVTCWALGVTPPSKPSRLRVARTARCGACRSGEVRASNHSRRSWAGMSYQGKKCPSWSMDLSIHADADAVNRYGHASVSGK